MSEFGKTFVIFLAVSSCLLLPICDVAAKEQGLELNPKLAEYVELRIAEFERIPDDRKASLAELARYISNRTSVGKTARLNFICTHNSRRSHMSQLWAAVAAARYGIDSVETYSGGTERTAFNPRAVDALRRAGYDVVVAKETDFDVQNPRYYVTFAPNMAPLVCFSKTYDSAPNPTSDFCAVMTCSEADRNCPVVTGAAYRVRLPYQDPKLADGTPEETEIYDERSAQIAREILYVFSLIE